MLAIGGRETFFLRDIFLNGIAWVSGQAHVLFSVEAKEGVLPECLYLKRVSKEANPFL